MNHNRERAEELARAIIDAGLKVASYSNLEKGGGWMA